MRAGIAYALGAALLFGASTPAAKALVGDVHPVLLAGLLYAGSGIGLASWILMRRAPVARIERKDLPWLAGAVAIGGCLAPLAFTFGLGMLDAASVALLLNLESVLTALLAWFVFRENFDRRIALGMALIVAGGVVLASGPAQASWGALAIAAASLGWAIDNNLTRRISAADAATVAAIKGAVAGAANLGLGAMIGAGWPGWGAALSAGAVGFFGYGVSLALFVAALRELGAARTGAYFATAPFVGVALALVLLGESPATMFWLAGALMAAGVWLHVTERHEHEHVHEAIEHDHRHVHDEHHRHQHDFAWQGEEPHAHRHRHARLVHKHPHYPDLHHRHH